MGKLFENMIINNMSLKNRLVMPPMATGKAPDGNVTDELCEYYSERARYSKIGLIITEHSYINMQGKAHPGQVSIASDGNIPGFKKLAECVHEEGVKIIAQINHAGSAASSKVTGMAPVGPSAVNHPRHADETPEEMTAEQIKNVVEWFSDAALRVKKAGFDGVEIHSAHGYLLNQFYSPLVNKRTDEYGPQSIENRTRLQCEILRAVRKTVGDDFAVAIRLGGCDYVEGGSTVEDCVAACRLFEENGADLIDITGGMYGYSRPNHNEPGYFKDMSAAVKQAVNVPVLLTGGVTAVSQAEELLDEGSADLIGVGRAIFKSAHWAE